eukprot:TRINITY_DN2577_c1_g1_i1.p1 TRINITY_DN2577_c1_g1~~TRINITY_DN2577_c1_g1_i1.p1  ORF type:complete len:229 (+),score=93.35 TRINITY_DN2577_c1_g1_i1:115-801(+)
MSFDLNTYKFIEAAPKTQKFSYYQDNGGTVLGVAGKDYAVAAADTRLSSGYSILTRENSKITKLTDKCVIASSGMQSDISNLHKHLISRIQQFEHQHNRKPSTPAIAQMLSNTLYYRRFMPYYAFNLLVGIDDKGHGAVYGYDAIGSFERNVQGSSGSGVSLVQPVLDSQIGWLNTGIREISAEEAVDLTKNALACACERDIYTGDFAQIILINSTGVHFTQYPMKFD